MGAECNRLALEAAVTLEYKTFTPGIGEHCLWWHLRARERVTEIREIMPGPTGPLAGGSVDHSLHH